MTSIFAKSVLFKSIVIHKEVLLIHEVDPQSWQVVITISARVVCTSVRSFVRPHFSQIKQISIENNVRYWRDCGSGRVDH